MMKSFEEIDFGQMESASVKKRRKGMPINKLYIPPKGEWMNLQMDEKTAHMIESALRKDGLDVRADFANDRMFIRAGGLCNLVGSKKPGNGSHITVTALKDSALEAYGTFSCIPACYEIARVGIELVVLVELDAGRAM